MPSSSRLSHRSHASPRNSYRWHADCARESRYIHPSTKRAELFTVRASPNCTHLRLAQPTLSALGPAGANNVPNPYPLSVPMGGARSKRYPTPIPIARARCGVGFIAPTRTKKPFHTTVSPPSTIQTAPRSERPLKLTPRLLCESYRAVCAPHAAPLRP